MSAYFDEELENQITIVFEDDEAGLIELAAQKAGVTPYSWIKITALCCAMFFPISQKVMDDLEKTLFSKLREMQIEKEKETFEREYQKSHGQKPKR